MIYELLVDSRFVCNVKNSIFIIIQSDWVIFGVCRQIFFFKYIYIFFLKKYMDKICILDEMNCNKTVWFTVA